MGETHFPITREWITDLNLGEVFHFSIIFHIPVSWLNLLHSYDFYFWWRDTCKPAIVILLSWTNELSFNCLLNNVSKNNSGRNFLVQKTFFFFVAPVVRQWFSKYYLVIFFFFFVTNESLPSCVLLRVNKFRTFCRIVKWYSRSWQNKINWFANCSVHYALNYTER